MTDSLPLTLTEEVPRFLLPVAQVSNKRGVLFVLIFIMIKAQTQY